jgi:hypothetical protein
MIRMLPARVYLEARTVKIHVKHEKVPVHPLRSRSGAPRPVVAAKTSPVIDSTSLLSAIPHPLRSD